MKLHFYKKTFPPVQNGCLRYYDYHNGIAGYDKEQDLSHYYGCLTFEQLDEKIKIKRADATKRALSRGRLI